MVGDYGGGNGKPHIVSLQVFLETLLSGVGSLFLTWAILMLINCGPYKITKLKF